MLRILLTVVLLATPLTAFSQTAERLTRHFDQVQSVKASFSQQLKDEDGMVLEEASGSMWLQRPGLFRWDYAEPYVQQIGSDGKTLWIYDQGLEQITLRPVSEGMGRTPAVLLSGEGDLFDEFNVTELEPRLGLDWLELVPKQQDTDFKSILLGFKADDLYAMELTDSLDQVTSIRFNDLERNPKLSKDRFLLRIPKGTEVVGERG